MYKTLKMFNSISYRHELFELGNYEFIMRACGNNNVEKLEWLKKSGDEFKYDNRAIIYASYAGQVQVLEWFKHSGYEFKYNEDAINSASDYGNIQVLEWFKHSGYKFKYNEWAINDAKKIIILKFFIENINPKKVIKWSNHKKINVLRFKAKKRYFKGYKKN